MSESHPKCEGKNRPIMLAISHAFHKVLVFQPACKQWSCPACAEVNRKRWAVRAFHGYEQLESEGLVSRFLTLTSHEKLTPEESLWVWPKAWSVLGQRARRTAERFEYLMIPERHKNGKIHIHALETSLLDTRWWKDNGRACGLGYIAEAEAIKNPQQAAWYVSKYIGKQLGETSWPKGFRRVRTSRGWPKTPEQPQHTDWEFRMMQRGAALIETVSRYDTAGYTTLHLDHAAAWVYVDASERDGEIV